MQTDKKTDIIEPLMTKIVIIYGINSNELISWHLKNFALYRIVWIPKFSEFDLIFSSYFWDITFRGLSSPTIWIFLFFNW
jgi:hypothetical protein